jgi:(1->4)-alpha-D-glucan 1-alpha-D-glucosylmutase
MAGELDNLVSRIKTAAVEMRTGRDLTTRNLKAALADILVRLPVYRTYFGAKQPGDADRTYLKTATELAVLNRPGLQAEITFLQRYLSGVYREPADSDARGSSQLRRQVLRRFEQLSAPLMAKGCEDTALYVYNRLLSLNEVGAEPGRFGCATDEFHRFMQQRIRNRPLSMNNSATHDSKRGEDVRARLNVLSEIPQLWEDRLRQWHELNRNRRRRHHDVVVPDKNEEYFLYQTLIGAWPADGRITASFLERMRNYLRKAAREAKVHTSWLDPDETYESLLLEFLENILAPSLQNRFREVLDVFVRRIAFYGFFNSLAQTLIKVTAPGIPDFYQGTELLECSLVDPDNRRPVDFAFRRDLLAEWNRQQPSDAGARLSRLLEIPDYDRIKFFVVRQALAVRRNLAVLFEKGRYLPLQSRGPGRRSVVAFARRRDKQWCITVVSRFLTSRVEAERLPLGAAVWGDTQVHLPENAPDKWRNGLTDRQIFADGAITVAEIFDCLPVALLTGENL